MSSVVDPHTPAQRPVSAASGARTSTSTTPSVCRSKRRPWGCGPGRGHLHLLSPVNILSPPLHMKHIKSLSKYELSHRDIVWANGTPWSLSLLARSLKVGYKLPPWTQHQMHNSMKKPPLQLEFVLEHHYFSLVLCHPALQPFYNFM
jgi:hypothetical protein